ncbi:MAG: phosphoribosylformylglycinamidine synthase subunit PurS [Bacteroidetes bacterium]|nr:phosphoribosylformylglycinamidine synthase subunit PurS [Bacteroidota bacterium]
MYKATIQIVLRPSILDVQGKAVLHAVHDLGYPAVGQIRIGKVAEVTLSAGSPEEAEKQVREISQKLLANPVMEDFSFTLEKL